MVARQGRDGGPSRWLDPEHDRHSEPFGAYRENAIGVFMSLQLRPSAAWPLAQDPTRYGKAPARQARS